MARGTYFTVHQVGGPARAVTVEVCGDLDAFTSRGFRAVMHAVMREREVGLDLSGCSFLDAAGVRSIVRSVQGIRAFGGRARITATSPRADLALRATGATDELLVPG